MPRGLQAKISAASRRVPARSPSARVMQQEEHEQGSLFQNNPCSLMPGSSGPYRRF